MSTRPSRLAAARAATERGWPVFPLVPYTKQPAVPDWERVATCDPDVLVRWWATAPYNIGVACGPAGLVVVDLDADHGHAPPEPWAARGVRHGRDVLALVAADHGRTMPADTYTVATPTGGAHLYFAAPPDTVLRNTAGLLGWHVDTRAAGGYVVAAGSLLRVDGRRRAYTVTNRMSPARLPDWLHTALRPHPAGPASTVVHPARLDAWVRAAVSREAATVHAAPVGRRNTTVFTAACRLGELVGAGVLSPAEVTTALADAARIHHGIDGFTAVEAERAIANGLRRGQANPRPIGADTT